MVVAPGQKMFCPIWWRRGKKYSASCRGRKCSARTVRCIAKWFIRRSAATAESRYAVLFALRSVGVFDRVPYTIKEPFGGTSTMVSCFIYTVPDWASASLR